MSARTVLHQLTLASIEAEGHIGDYDRLAWRCGCERDGDRWWLCGYHDGFEDAALLIGETLQKHHPEPDFIITMRADVAEITICAECRDDWPCPTYKTIVEDDR